MVPRLGRQDDGEKWKVEQWYGKPQHETGTSISELELYGEPQHDVLDDSALSDFNPDFSCALDWFDFPRKADDNSERLILSATER